MTNAFSKRYPIAENGRHHLLVDHAPKSNMTLTVEWLSPDISPAGTLAFSVDGDTGENNVKDLSGPGRVWVTNGRPPFFDMDVAGLPEGGSFALYIW